jgi:hypothetical protein
MGKKTDNYNLPAKIALRRHFLLRYHAFGPMHVLDCCQGGGVIWRLLRREFDVATYWGVDVKSKKGRLKIDSTRILSQAGWPQNVIDIDTYGSPWKHWEAMLPNVDHPTTVFLTIGQLTTGTVGKLGNVVLDYLRLGKIGKRLSPAFHVKLAPHVLRYCLARAYDYGIIITEAVEAVSDGNCRYVGVHLAPTKSEQPGLQPGCPEHPIPTTEESNV